VGALPPRLTAEQRLQPRADTERQSSEGRDNLALFGLYVGPQLGGQVDWGRLLAPGNHDGAQEDRACCSTESRQLPSLASLGFFV